MVEKLSNIKWDTNYWSVKTQKPKSKNDAQEIFEREQILQPYLFKKGDMLYGWSGGTRHIQKVPVEVIELLIRKGYLKRDENQNQSPTTDEFLRFMKQWRRYKVLAHGYEVSKERNDCRVTIEGLETDMRPGDELFDAAWLEFNHSADENGFYYSWWD
jgi:hypothetical protein